MHVYVRKSKNLKIPEDENHHFTLERLLKML